MLLLGQDVMVDDALVQATSEVVTALGIVAPGFALNSTAGLARRP